MPGTWKDLNLISLLWIHAYWGLVEEMLFLLFRFNLVALGLMHFVELNAFGV